MMYEESNFPLEVQGLFDAVLPFFRQQKAGQFAIISSLAAYNAHLLCHQSCPEKLWDVPQSLASGGKHPRQCYLPWLCGLSHVCGHARTKALSHAAREGGPHHPQGPRTRPGPHFLPLPFEPWCLGSGVWGFCLSAVPCPLPVCLAMAAKRYSERSAPCSLSLLGRRVLLSLRLFCTF